MNIYRTIKILFLKIRFLSRLNWYKHKSKELKILVGGGKTKFKDWIHTDINILDVALTKNWKNYFNKNEISNILAEHVWEHLTIKESKLALKNCYTFLKKGGRLRIAVPDGYSPDKNYINMVKPGGFGCGSDDHKILYNYEKLKKEVESVGFSVELVEYFDKKGDFIKNKWSAKDGFINRSFDYDKRNKHGLKYTSLIIDGVKS